MPTSDLFMPTKETYSLIHKYSLIRKECGCELKDDAKVCSKCGEPVANYYKRRERKDDNNDDDDNGSILGTIGDIVGKLL